MRQSTLAVFATLALASLAAAQPASYRLFGTPCKHTTVPTVPFTNVGLPRLGSTYFVQTNPSLQPIMSTNVYFVITGTSRTQYGSLALPFNVAPLTSPGTIWCGHLYASIDIIQPVPIGTFGVPALIPFSLPAQPSLSGVKLYQQAMLFHATVFDLTYAFSAAGEATLGT